MTHIATARAHTNIALIKYWGKRDEQLFLPMNSSLSLTLEAFYTETTVELDSALNQDTFILNETLQSEQETNKISRFLDLFRQETHNYTPARVTSQNFVPTAAGLASSASAFAALGTAMNEASRLRLPRKELSTYVRQGSGSATRSLFGGFVEWQMGTHSQDSFAYEVDDASWDIAMVTVAINTEKKSVSSRVGMKQTVDTSPFYPAWVESAQSDLVSIKAAIQARDFQQLGEITEANGMKMHGTMLGANPPFSYWQARTVEVLAKIREMRGQGWQVYFTMDAGPNVKVLCRQTEAKKIQTLLQDNFPANPVIVSGVGKGAKLLSDI